MEVMVKKSKQVVEPVVPVVDGTTLPMGWELKTIDAICRKVEKTDPKQVPGKEIKYIDIGGIDNQLLRIVDTKSYLGKDAPSRARQLVKANDVVISTVRTYLKNIALVPDDLDGQVASTGFCVLRTGDPWLGKYLYYFVQSDAVLKEIGKQQRGSSYPAVRDSDIKAQFIPVPPKQDLRQIVESIELQLGRLDAAVARLQGAKARLKRYKQAVLKAAVEGRLTEEWRENRAAFQSEADWHQQLLTTRKRNQLSELAAKGKKAGDKAYKVPVSIESLDATDTELEELPNGWTWATADEITIMITDGEHATPPRTDSGVPLLSARNIRDGWISFETIDHVSEETHEKLAKRLRVQEGDVLLSCSGSVGRCCVAPSDSHFSLVRSVAVLRPILKMGSYLSYAIRSPLVQAQINSRKTQTAQANIFQGKIKQLAIPMPQLDEQKAIVAALDSILSATDEMESSLDAQFQQAIRLRQAVLRRAFEGRLV